MVTTPDSLSRELALRDALVDAGLLLPTAVPGVCGWSAGFEGVVAAIGRLVTAAGAGTGQSIEAVQFPPVMPRAAFERTGYVRSFPHLAGSVHTFAGNERDHAAALSGRGSAAGWTGMLEPSDVVLCSAACHPVYPQCTGRLPRGGRRFAVTGWCFRHEPAVDPARLQSFRMHEVVFLGEPDAAVAHRDLWVGLGADLLTGLGLEVEVVAATDPFFGRAGQLLADAQMDQALKLEITAPVSRRDEPTALVSSNCHGDHFGEAFGITTDGGLVAHSACVGFGLERVVLALLARHGPDLEQWPASVRERLRP